MFTGSWYVDLRGHFLPLILSRRPVVAKSLTGRCKQLPHVHLLSTYRYALMPRPEGADVQKWLLAAPKIARDTAPFYWTYLDCPQDGTIFLTWQPTARRSLEFASDGYVWPHPETYYRTEIGSGLVRNRRKAIALLGLREQMLTIDLGA
jgi:hypothetical protein